MRNLPPFPVEKYRLDQFYANGAKIRPLPAKSFSSEDVKLISDWLRSIGWSVTSGSGVNVIKVTNDLGMTVDDLPEPYTAAQFKRDKAMQAANERSASKKKEFDDYIANTDAGKFVSEVFGQSMNAFNQTALAKVLSGDEVSFGGLFSVRAADALNKIGIVIEGRKVTDVILDIQALFQKSKNATIQPNH